jgi:hypothetical protein
VRHVDGLSCNQFYDVLFIIVIGSAQNNLERFCSCSPTVKLQGLQFCFTSIAFLTLSFLNLRSIVNQSIADASSANISRQPLLMPMGCQELVFWIGEGYREER